MGLQHRSLRQLASAHLVVAHDRHSIVRIKCGCTSHHQCAFPHRERAPSFFAAGSRDTRALAKRDGSSAVCVASIACRIGGLDRRTQRRAQYIFSVVIPWCLRAVHGVEPAKAPLLSLLCFAAGLTAKPMLVTLPFIFVLLDYWPLKRGSHQFRRLVIEKVPFFLFTAVSSIVTFAAQRNAGAVAPLESVPLRYRLGNALLAYTRYLQKTFLACETGRHLSDFERVLVVANCSRPGAVSRNLDCRCLFVALPGLAFCRLVLVYRHAGPHDWPRSGRHSVDGRSVYLFASRGNFCDVGLDRR